MAACRISESRRKQKDGVVNNLKDLFGNVLHIDIIRSVAAECNYDVKRSSNALIEMASHVDQQALKKKEKPKKSTPPKARVQVVKSKKSLEIERVIGQIRQGYKVLVILRGLPGSGKSHLANLLTDVTLGPGTNSHHILSTDDYFAQQNGYVFDPTRIQEAHEWNQRRAFEAMSRGLSPVIIDNTNTQMWEMKPYATMATDYGYIIEILEPDTPWIFHEKELARRNKHGVPRAKISEMLDRYDKNVTPLKLLQAYNLRYKFQKPPQFRLVPPIQTTFPPPSFEFIPKSKSTSAISDALKENINLMEFSEVSTESNNNEDETEAPVNPVDEILMCTDLNSADVLQPNPVGTPNHLFPDVENAWGIDEKALQSWDIVTPIQCNFETPQPNTEPEEAKPETRDSSTSTEPRDFLTAAEVPSGSHVLVAQNRDINLDCPLKNFAPPKKIMLDKSCITEDDDADEETSIKDLMDLFPGMSRSALQELFYKCHKNFHYTVDLLLEDNNLEIAASLIGPAPEARTECGEIQDEAKEPKVFKRKPISEDSLELKKCLESKFDINKEHYSEHVYKVKQFKFGGFPEPQPSTSTLSDSEESDDSNGQDEEPKNMIEINLGETLVQQLETLFSANDDPFPKGFQPVVQMPIALVRQIYTYYIESICQQMETQNFILERLVKEDEEFAKKLQNEETPPEPIRVMNFSEIMDEQVALSLHKKDVDSWKNLTADNLAAKLTKQKLFSAFPEVDREALVEIWHANDYNYKKTVDDLVASVGVSVNYSGEALSEPPLSVSVLQEMKLAEQECGDFEEPEEQKPATFYRDEAEKHLRKRKELYEKAREHYTRGNTQVAMFYSDLARKETTFYDRANHLAAATFIEEHSKRLQKFDTLDLHYFHVKEAISTLDIFIDRNINLLKGSSKSGQDLFIITGRGKHSEGGKAKIKPAVVSRLQKRKIGYVQLNAGLLKIRVKSDSLITSDIP